MDFLFGWDSFPARMWHLVLGISLFHKDQNQIKLRIRSIGGEIVIVIIRKIGAYSDKVLIRGSILPQKHYY